MANERSQRCIRHWHTPQIRSQAPDHGVGELRAPVVVSRFEQVVLQKEKNTFLIAKDDIMVGVSKPMSKNEIGRGNQRNKAYPSVVTTLARTEQGAKNYLAMLFHNSKDFTERDSFISFVERRPDAWDPTKSGSEVAKKQITEVPEIYLSCMSVGITYPHQLSVHHDEQLHLHHYE